MHYKFIKQFKDKIRYILVMKLEILLPAKELVLKVIAVTWGYDSRYSDNHPDFMAKLT